MEWVVMDIFRVRLLVIMILAGAMNTISKWSDNEDDKLQNSQLVTEGIHYDKYFYHPYMQVFHHQIDPTHVHGWKLGPTTLLHPQTQKSLVVRAKIRRSKEIRQNYIIQHLNYISSSLDGPSVLNSPIHRTKFRSWFSLPNDERRDYCYYLFLFCYST